MFEQQWVRRRLLIVSDSETVCGQASRYFTRLLLPVDCTHSFDDASIRLANSRYAAILVHLGATGIDGAELVTHVDRLLRHANRAPVVLVVRNGLPYRAEHALQGRVSQYFDGEAPLAEIARAVYFLLARAGRTHSGDSADCEDSQPAPPG